MPGYRLKSTFIKEKQNLIIRKAGIEIEIPENSNAVIIRYPEATFSTNAAERSVKSWVMARRNFLFSGSGNGARASCFIKGLLQTLKTAKSRL